jgi:hypothetical protein
VSKLFATIRTDQNAMSATPVATFPVAIMMSRKLIRRSGWSLPCWEATGVVSGEQFADRRRSRTLVHEADDVQHFLFRGFELPLFRDAAETYWYNLTGERPSLFVICQKEDGDELVPNMVTPDHGVAQAAVEHDGAAFAVPIPPDIHAEIERVVLEHYRPEPPRKRKRHDWGKEDEL